MLSIILGAYDKWQAWRWHRRQGHGTVRADFFRSGHFWVTSASGQRFLVEVWR